MRKTRTRDPKALRQLRELRRALTRASIVFGSLAVVVVMALGSMQADRGPSLAWQDQGIDEMMTGSIGTGERYVVSRSVLQPSGSAPCLRYSDGSTQGVC